jgi:hypothetical protein
MRLDVAAARRTLTARGTMVAFFVLGACGGNGTSSLGHDNAAAGDGAMAGTSGGAGASSSTGGRGAATGGTTSAGASGAAASSSGGNVGVGGLENAGGSHDDGSGGSATGGKTATGGSGGAATGGTTASGGTTATGGSTSTGGSDGSTYTCDGAPCCAATKLSVDEIWVEQTSVTLLVELVDDGIRADVTADVVVPGGEATCSSGAYSFQFRTLTCNLLPALDPWLTCDSTVPLQIRLRSSTYSDTDTTTPLCAAEGSLEIELDKTVLCPTCPSGLQPYGETNPCDIPGQYCLEASVANSPCTCKMDYRTGERAWECPMPSGGP